uniref:EXPERA domain-containing protein n=1 Tax=Magallana gigas TaxID=29159 RepID=A0A8W8L300_MAGGI
MLSFPCRQNYVEVLLSIFTIILHHKSSRHTRLMAYNVNIMTMWKTVTYFLMFTDICGAGHWIGTDSSLTLTLLFYFPNGVWIGVPLLAMYHLWPSFTQGQNEKQGGKKDK